MERIDHADLHMLTKLLIENNRKWENKRFLLGITGIPGAGKSTLANSLMKNINEILHKEIAIVVPMDGFHYHNDILVTKGLLAVKGSFKTFDSEKFVALIKKIASEKVEKIYCPAYDRNLHNPVDDSILIESKHKIIIVEGNYLLLDTCPWKELVDLFDESWFIDTPQAISKERLINRHIVTGRSASEAFHKVNSTDTPNAELILQTRYRANKIIMVGEI